MILDKYTVLKKYFGYDEFRCGQAEIIDKLAEGKDVLAVMPTGGGKSLCYQIPALMSDGITIVVSPLISLMKDQVLSLVQSGVRAAYINSSLTTRQYYKAVSNMRDGVYKIIYVSPERLSSDSFLSVCRSLDIRLVAVDEAHCISGWGQDFRPAYLGISRFIDELPSRPTIGAFTATATERVRRDIVEYLELSAPFEITTGFDRPNLYFDAVQTTKKTKQGELLKLLERYVGKCGIVYCGTRGLCDELCSLLNLNGYRVSKYHAGLSDEERHRAQDDFIFDRCDIMVATNAFGMGIDKSNVSFVIHYNMPKDIESYYQEAGRAGRDGKNAECIMLWSESDIMLNKFLIEKSEENSDIPPEMRAQIKKNELYKLNLMIDYCRTIGCRRAFLLRYFGEETAEKCGNCGNCNGEYTVLDVTEDAKKILSCIARTDNTFGLSTISAILRASMNEKVEQYSLDEISVYGIMRGKTEKYIRRIADELRMQGYLYLDGEYCVPTVSKKAEKILYGNEHIFMRESLTVPKTEKKKRAEEACSENGGLLMQLKAERTKIARELSVPAYVIFSDAALYDMCRIMPRDKSEFLTVSGIGKVKAEKYGEKFLSIIGKFR